MAIIDKDQSSAEQAFLAATQPTRPQFDFKAYNALMRNAGSGLRLYLAAQSLTDVEATMLRFRSPLANDLHEINNHLSHLIAANKKLAEASRNAGPAPQEIENPNPADNTVGSKDKQLDAAKASQQASPE